MPTLPLIPENKKIKYLVIGALVFLVCYLGSAFWGLPRAHLIGFSWLDEQIPFLPWTVWFYTSQYFVLSLSHQFDSNRHRFYDFTSNIITEQQSI